MIVQEPHSDYFIHRHPHDFCGVPCWLYVPEAKTAWSAHNLHYRSLITERATDKVVSTGWPKFFNLGERPTCYPDPNSYNDWVITEKLDGSLLILDYYNGQLSMRTRGSVSHTTQANASDFEELFVQHPELQDWKDENVSLLFEICTPNNVIVIRPDKVRFVLLGGVYKTDLSILTDKQIQKFAGKYKLNTPLRYNFNSIWDIAEEVKNWKGLEGVVLSYNNNQNRIKLKSDWYQRLHKIKSQLNSEANLLEFYVVNNMPSYDEFFHQIETTFDWEIANQLRGQISRLVDASKQVKSIVDGMLRFVDTIKGLPTRKEQAQLILSSYGQTNRASMVFALLDGKNLSNEQLTKLLYQVLS